MSIGHALTVFHLYKAVTIVIDHAVNVMHVDFGRCEI
jgi:hypothetical protein